MLLGTLEPNNLSREPSLLYSVARMARKRIRGREGEMYIKLNRYPFLFKKIDIVFYLKKIDLLFVLKKKSKHCNW